MSDAELAQFRAEWSSELKRTTAAPGETRESTRPNVERTALEYYAEAVHAEDEGRMGEALTNYRTAFRLDPDIDKHYHLQTLAPKSGPRPQLSVAPNDFTFKRTVQLAPDYKDEKEREQGGTDILRESLLKSIAANPWVRPKLEIAGVEGNVVAEVEQDERPKPITVEEAYDQLQFIPSDESKPIFLSTLPHEVLILVLKSLATTPSLVQPRPIPADVPLIPVAMIGKSKKPRTIQDEMKHLALELELEPAKAWITDQQSLERFASTCRFARILSLEIGIWKDICSRTFFYPQIAREETATSLVQDLRGDWRRLFIEQPRLRLDGCYISVITYIRRGESHQAFLTPTHLITFYRYLRFYPNGLVVSLLTVDAPSTVVRQLNPTLRVKGMLRGKWILRGDQIDLWNLEDPNVAREQRRYSFQMTLRLKSTARGRMNKLDLVTLATEHRTTLEVEDVPIRPTKPFFFSKVGLYCVPEEEKEHI